MSSSYIGKCEILFCVLPASETLFIPAYGEEKSICEECYKERTGEIDVDEDSKRYQLGEIARDLFDQERGKQ